MNRTGVAFVCLGLVLVVGLVKSFGSDVELKEPPVAKAADEPKFKNGYTLASSPEGGGLFVHRRSDRPFACLISLAGENKGETIAALGFGTSDQAVVDDGGFPFAVVADKDGVHLQIKGKDGKIHLLPVEKLLKLADKGD